MSLNEYKEDKPQIVSGNFPQSYKRLVDFMKHLRTFFANHYQPVYVIGSMYSDPATITYFPFTPETLKEQKLKVAIVYNHQKGRFEIWLAGQNKQIQKKYWEIFKGSDWNKYHIPTSTDEGFSIVDDVLIENPDFDDQNLLREEIETKALEFIREIRKVLE